ncbi:MAG: hypothetical protein AAF639_26250 [Chloroflexota bacterium]
MSTQVLSIPNTDEIGSYQNKIDYALGIFDYKQLDTNDATATNGQYTIVDILKQLLDELRHHFNNFEQKKANLEKFTEILSDHLWSAYELYEQSYHNLIFLLRRCIHRVNPIAITRPQIDAFEYGLHLLEKPHLADEHVFDCKLRFESVEINTEMDWRHYGIALAELYKEEI